MIEQSIKLTVNDLFYINSADDLKYSFYSCPIEIEEEKGE